MAYKYNPPTANVTQSRQDLKDEFRRWNQQAGELVVTDYELPYANAGTIEAEVVFQLRGQRVRVKIDVWDTFATNLRCCYLNIRDMRLAEARGSLDAMRETFMALPPPAKERDPWEILGARPDADWEDVKALYQLKAKRLHPDTGENGGDSGRMAELNEAFEKVRKQRGQ